MMKFMMFLFRAKLLVSFFFQKGEIYYSKALIQGKPCSTEHKIWPSSSPNTGGFGGSSKTCQPIGTHVSFPEHTAKFTFLEAFSQKKNTSNTIQNTASFYGS